MNLKEIAEKLRGEVNIGHLSDPGISLVRLVVVGIYDPICG